MTQRLSWRLIDQDGTEWGAGIAPEVRPGYYDIPASATAKLPVGHYTLIHEDGGTVTSLGFLTVKPPSSSVPFSDADAARLREWCRSQGLSAVSGLPDDVQRWILA